jgi:hypothetical protein
MKLLTAVFCQWSSDTYYLLYAVKLEQKKILIYLISTTLIGGLRSSLHPHW